MWDMLSRDGSLIIKVLLQTYVCACAVYACVKEEWLLAIALGIMEVAVFHYWIVASVTNH